MTSTELAGLDRHYRPCPAGRHWGAAGAAGCLVWTEYGGRVYVLLAKRSKYVQAGGTWSVPGGAIDRGESPWLAAVRELAEEVHGIDVRRGTVTGEYVAACPAGCGWSYRTFAVRVRLAGGRLPRVAVRRGRDAWETSAVRWVAAQDVAGMRLHPGLAAAWPSLREQIAGERP